MSGVRNPFVRAIIRAKYFGSVGVNWKSRFVLSLLSNHRTAPLAKWITYDGGIIVDSAGDIPLIFDFKSADHKTIFAEVFLQKVYTFEMLPFVPESILDCGAHVGFFSRLAAASFPATPIWAFEPNPENVRFLDMQCRGFRNIQKLDVAVGTYDGWASFVGTGCQGAVKLAGTQGRKVQVIDLARWLDKFQTKNSLLLKMDIEGGEYDLIPHILPVLPRRSALFYETHSSAGDSRALTFRLEGEGFKVTEVRSREDNGQRFADWFALRV